MTKPAKKPFVTYGVKKVPGGWSTAEVHTLDGRVTKEVVSEPDFKDIILEKFQRQITVFWFPEDE